MKKYLFLLSILFVPFVFAEEQKVDHYGIALSNVCLTMISNNIDTDCPTYEEIMVLFPDTTDQSKTGKFEMIDGMVQRGQSQVLKPFNLYVYSTKSMLWIDPPGEVRPKLKMIMIEPSLPAYKIGNESLKMNDYSVSFGKDRYINLNCSEIRITAENWVFLTGDSINILNHQCDKSVSAFEGREIFNFEKSYQDLTTSSKYKLDEFIKLSKEKYKSFHLGLDENINRSVLEDENE